MKSSKLDKVVALIWILFMIYLIIYAIYEMPVFRLFLVVVGCFIAALVLFVITAASIEVLIGELDCNKDKVPSPPPAKPHIRRK